MSRTWPEDWEERKAGAGCPMCASGRVEEDSHGARFFAGEYTDAYLQKVEFQRGYTVVIWRGRHVGEPTEMTDDEAMAYWLEVLAASRAIEKHLGPAKLNFQLLGNAVPHVHTHIVPRYTDDSAPGRPIDFPGPQAKPRPRAEFEADLEALRRLTGYARR